MYGLLSYAWLNIYPDLSKLRMIERYLKYVWHFTKYLAQINSHA